MHPRLSNKILRPDFQGEFTASILAAAASPELISFAGGLPNPVSFPVEEMDKAAHKVLEHNGVMALQYSGTQGYQPLREWVAKRYETMGVSGVQADDIIITNGSQQVLTMMGACMLDPGDRPIWSHCSRSTSLTPRSCRSPSTPTASTAMRSRRLLRRTRT